MFKKRVLIISNDLLIGGSELNALKLTQILPFKFFWLSLKKRKIQYFNNFGFIEKFFFLNNESKRSNTVRKILSHTYKVNKILKENKINTIYAIGFYPSFISSILKTFKNINLITTRRGMDKAYDLKFFLPNFFINLLSNTIETNSKIIFKENKNKFLLRSKIKLVKNIIPDYIYSKKIKRFSNKFIVIGINSNLRPIKNPKLLQTVIEYYCKKNNNIHFRLLGRDHNQTYKKLKINFKKKVKWEKFIQNDKIIKFYNLIDILMITSFFESAPNVILEAFANKIPVVSTPNLGAKSLIRNNFDGIVSNNFEKNNFINCIETVIKKRKKFSNNIKKNFLRKYNHEKNIDKIKSFF